MRIASRLAPVLLLLLLACGGPDAPATPNAGHYAGTLTLSRPGQTDNIVCSMDFTILEAPGYGGPVTMNCTGAMATQYVGHAFLLGGHSLSFDLKTTRGEFCLGETPADYDCEFEGYTASAPAQGNLEGCGDLRGRYDFAPTSR